MSESIPKCGNCPICRRAQAKPESFIARIWRWHTGWCPGWKKYQRWLDQQAQGTKG